MFHSIHISNEYSMSLVCTPKSAASRIGSVEANEMCLEDITRLNEAAHGEGFSAALGIPEAQNAVVAPGGREPAADIEKQAFGVIDMLVEAHHGRVKLAPIEPTQRFVRVAHGGGVNLASCPHAVVDDAGVAGVHAPQRDVRRAAVDKHQLAGPSDAHRKEILTHVTDAHRFAREYQAVEGRFRRRLRSQ